MYIYIGHSIFPIENPTEISCRYIFSVELKVKANGCPVVSGTNEFLK